MKARPALRLGLLVPILVLGACVPSALAAPRLVSPDGGVRLRTSFPELVWEPVTGAGNYIVSIVPDEAAGGSEIIQSTSATRLVPTIGLRVGQAYTWRVAADNGLGRSAWSEARPLLVAANELPVPPVQDADYGALRNGEAVDDNAIRLHWHPRQALGAQDFYELEILYGDGGHLASRAVARERVASLALMTGLLDGLDSDSVNAYHGSVSIGVDCGATYLWRVRTVRADRLSPSMGSLHSALATAEASPADLSSGASAWSATWSFRIGEPIGGAPTLTSPADGARVSRGRLRWSSPPGEPDALATEVEVTDAPGVPGTRAWFEGPAFIPELLPEDRLTGFPVTLVQGRTYFWRARASVAVGMCPGPWSGYRSFIWTGETTDLGALPPPSCVDVTGTGCPTREPPPPTPTRTPRPSATLISLPGITLIAHTPTLAPEATKTPIVPPTDTKEPPPPTDKPKETEPPPDPPKK